MNRSLVASLLTLVVALPARSALAENPAPGPLLDKAIKAVGGDEKSSKVKAIQWKSKAKVTIEGNENEMKLEGTSQGLDHYRVEFQGDFGGNSFKGVTVVNGDKGWRKFGDQLMELDADALRNEKRTIYLAASHMNPSLLKGKEFKLEAADGATVQGKPADAIKIIGPDGKDSTLYIDKESGLPVRQVAKVVGWMGEEYTQDSTFSDYKEFGGLKVPTKVTVKRDGEDFVSQEISDVKFLEEAPKESFDEPK